MTSAVTFPLNQGTWIPDQELWREAASGLVLVCGEALDQQGRGEPYSRRTYSHGGRIPWKVGLKSGQQGQILVSLMKVFLGKAGQEQFQFLDGEYGKAGKRTMQFVVQLINSFPTIRGGTTGTQIRDSDIEDATDTLWQDGLIVLSALWALNLRGVQITPPIPPLLQNQVLVGSLDPVGPEGGLGGWEVMVYVQM